MGRYTWFVVTFSILPVMVITGVLLLFFAGRSDSPADPLAVEGLEKDIALYMEVRQKLLDHYDGELDEAVLRNEALMGLARGTGDDYTRVLPPVQSRDQKEGLEGGFFGIGSSVDFNTDGSVRLTTIHPGGGADRAGLQEDDVIVAVDGRSIIDMNPTGSIQLIKGDEEGSIVTLTILRGGDPTSGIDPDAERIRVDVERVRVETFSVHDVHIETRDGRRIGYCHVNSFNRNTYDDQFTNAVSELASRGAEGLVIDLRRNGGGSVDVAAQFVDGLLPGEGKLIVSMRSTRETNRADDRSWRTKDAETITDLPIVVIVDDTTASAAEIVTGALRDHGRAFVIGERSFGKGLVQTVFRLETDPRYSLNVTTSRYYTPLGLRVQKGRNGEPGGISPDITIQYEPGEKDKVHSRLVARRARYDREETAANSDWWDYEDRMLEAALDVLTRKAVSTR